MAEYRGESHKVGLKERRARDEDGREDRENVSGKDLSSLRGVDVLVDTYLRLQNVAIGV